MIKEKKSIHLKTLSMILGHSTTVTEVLLVLLPSCLLTVLMVWTGVSVFKDMGLLRSIIMILLVFDILAGVISNLTPGTNDYYANHPRLRYLFFALHVQPLLFSWLMGSFFLVCLLVWLYTIIMAVIVNRFQEHSSQRTIAGVGLTIGLSLFLLFAQDIPAVLFMALVMFMIKVIYSFSVDHTYGVKNT